MPDEQIVQEISIEGSDESADAFTKIGDAAEQGLNKIDKGAASASVALNKLSTDTDEFAKKTNAGFKQAGDGAATLQKVEAPARSLSTVLQAAGTAASTFATRTAVIAGTATAAVGGLILLSASLLKTITRFDDAGKSSRQLRQEVQQQNQVFTDREVRAVQNASAITEQLHKQSLDKVESLQSQKFATEDLQLAQSHQSSDLLRQLQLGRISQQQFADAKSDLDRKQGQESSDLFFRQLRDSQELARIQLRDRNELIRTQRVEAQVAEEVQKIQQRAAKRQLEEVAELNKAQEKRLAMIELVKKFGQDLTSSLLRLGDAAESFWRQFVAGPSAAASAVDIVTAVLERVGGKLIEFWGRIGKAIAGVFNAKDSEDAIDSISKKIVAFGEEVTTIFEKIIAPAFSAFLDIVGFVAAAINGIFGTNFSAGGLLFLGLILKLTGAFGLLKAVIPLVGIALRALFGLILTNPIGLILTALTLLGIFLLKDVDWAEFGRRAKAVADDIVKWWNGVEKFFVDTWKSIKQGATDAWSWVASQFGQLVQFFQNLPQTVLGFFAGLWQSIKDGATDVWEWIKLGFTNAWAFAKKQGQDFATWFNETWLGQFIGTIQTAIRWVAKLFQAKQEAANADGVNPNDPLGGGAAIPFARGGVVNGPGTPTSDSIWARLSRGEFVMRAAAVQRYGASFMHSINQMRAPKFNMGGLVDRLQMPLIPHLAGGGHVSQAGTGRPLVLNIGGESFHLMTRDGETAEQIGRFATQRRITSTGRKPSHWGA